MKKMTGNIVKVRPSDPKKAAVYTLMPTYHGEYNETKTLVHPISGEEMTVRYNWDSLGEVQLNLDNPVDAATYEWLQGHPMVKGAHPRLKLINEGERVDKTLSYKRLLTKAYNIIDALQGTKLANFARVLGLSTLHISEDALKSAVFEYADKEPGLVIQEWEDKDRAVKEMLKTGHEKGIFKVNKAGVWMWGEHNMGINFEQAVEFLKAKENADLIPGINKELKKI
tara:strand:+ start:828 stop:1505 length:678 start_codon:yes stop_codon:yes gene_type:complete